MELTSGEVVWQVCWGERKESRRNTGAISKALEVPTHRCALLRVKYRQRNQENLRTWRYKERILSRSDRKNDSYLANKLSPSPHSQIGFTRTSFPQAFSQPISSLLTHSSPFIILKLQLLTLYRPSFLHQPLLHPLGFPIPQKSCYRATPQSPKGHQDHNRQHQAQDHRRTLLPALRPGPST